MLALGVLSPVVVDKLSVRANQPEHRSSPNVVRVNSEHYDLRRSGARCDGVTDDTEAWADAVAVVAGGGGGKIWWRGTSIASQVELTDQVGLLGLGPEASVLKQRAGRAEGQHLVLLNEPDARSVTLQDFSINGNASKQQSHASGIYFDNSDGRGVLARHLIRNLHIKDVAGTGLFWGHRMRSSLIDGVVVYKCDGLRCTCQRVLRQHHAERGMSASRVRMVYT